MALQDVFWDTDWLPVGQECTTLTSTTCEIRGTDIATDVVFYPFIWHLLRLR